jgi:hypothetical protein
MSISKETEEIVNEVLSEKKQLLRCFDSIENRTNVFNKRYLKNCIEYSVFFIAMKK